MVEVLIGDGLLSNSAHRRERELVGGQCAERRTAGFDEVFEIAVVLPVRVLGVVVRAAGAGIDRGVQRSVKLAPVADRICVGLLGERVEVVEGHLVGGERAHHTTLCRARHERGERHRPLGAATLGVLRFERQPTQRRIVDLSRARLPVAQLEHRAREHAQPVAACGVHERACRVHRPRIIREERESSKRYAGFGTAPRR